MENYDVAQQYYEIGQWLRVMGADQVVLLSSKIIQGAQQKLRLEIAVDGEVDLQKIYGQSPVQWPDVEMEVFLRTESLDGELLDEIREYGILL